MRFFFYGTLMDLDVLRRVLGRPVAAALKPAVLGGWRRSAIHGASYPIVVRDKAGRVDGLSLDGVSKPEADRLSAYEGPRYDLVRAFADFPGLGRRAVFFYQPRPGVFRPTEAAWSLSQWQATHKAKFLAGLSLNWPETASAVDRR
jgi:hypothetical protein